uniref:Small integral membrane protein 15 n=1 Tax=Panagrellus redivivus TaxID=6233 RepID=A0A7E4UN72_PANRE
MSLDRLVKSIDNILIHLDENLTSLLFCLKIFLPIVAVSMLLIFATLLFICVSQLMLLRKKDAAYSKLLQQSDEPDTMPTIPPKKSVIEE